MPRRRNPQQPPDDDFVLLGTARCQICGHTLDIGVSKSQLRVWLALSTRHPQETARTFGNRHLRDLVTLLRNSHVRHRCNKQIWTFQCPN